MRMQPAMSQISGSETAPAQQYELKSGQRNKWRTEQTKHVNSTFLKGRSIKEQNGIRASRHHMNFGRHPTLKNQSKIKLPGLPRDAS